MFWPDLSGVHCNVIVSFDPQNSKTLDQEVNKMLKKLYEKIIS